MNLKAHIGCKKPRLGADELILLAEDHEEEILSLYEAFKRADIRNPLFVVFDGQHAIDYLAGVGKFQERNKFPLPSLLLASTALPQKSGFEILKWLRQDGNPLRELPVILLTSQAQESEVRQALELCALDYVPKFKCLDQTIEWARALKDTYLEFSTGPLRAMAG